MRVKRGSRSVFAEQLLAPGGVFFLIGQMIIVGSSYWRIAIGREKGEVEKDEEGMKTMQVLGENLLWLLQKIH